MNVKHDSSSVLAMATNTLHNALCKTLNLFLKKLAFAYRNCPLSLETITQQYAHLDCEAEKGNQFSFVCIFFNT